MKKRTQGGEVNTIRDGERLSIIGGPHDGGFARVSVILPFIKGGIPCGILKLGQNFYELDKGARVWRYKGVTR